MLSRPVDSSFQFPQFNPPSPALNFSMKILVIELFGEVYFPYLGILPIIASFCYTFS